MRNFTLFLFALTAMVWTSCSTSSALITTTRPPDLILADDIVNILVVDRSRPSNQAVTVLEGVVTGEQIGSDFQGRVEVMHSLFNIMSLQDRFALIDSDLELKGSASGARAKSPLKEEKVMQLAQDFEADAVLVLEAFDSDGRNVVSGLISLGAVTAGIFDPVAYPNNLRTSWRLYDGLDGKVLDEFQTFETQDGWWTYSALYPSEQFLAVTESARSAAFQYAGRIVPLPVNYQRRYYKRGIPANRELLRAHRMVSAQRWERAEQMWERIYQVETKRRPRARAAYNLAIAAERKGDLDLALNWLEKSIELGNDKAIGYASNLTEQKELMMWQRMEEIEDREDQDDLGE